MVAGLAGIFPDAHLLPFGIDPILVAGVGYVHFIAVLIPPIGIMMAGFAFVLVFKFALMVIRAIPIIGRMVTARSYGFTG